MAQIEANRTSLATMRRGARAISEPIPSEDEGWWRIVETSQWEDDGLDIRGPALLSISGHDDRLRMHSLLAYVTCEPTKDGRVVHLGGRLEV